MTPKKRAQIRVKQKNAIKSEENKRALSLLSKKRQAGLEGFSFLSGLLMTLVQSEHVDMPVTAFGDIHT